MYLYLITNLINGKKYVGITNNYKKRWSNECSYPKDVKRRQVIQEAIHKYGKENFKFEVLKEGLGLEEAVQEEERLIKELETCNPDKGYNKDLGGNYFPYPKPQLGEKNGMAKITDKEAQYILDNRDKPMYVLYEDFNEKISYEEFKSIYHHRKFKHLSTNTEMYPYNTEFSYQFCGSKLDYDDIIKLREQYKAGIYWRDAYEDYKELFPNEWSFWGIYNGKRYKYIMPEIFDKGNKHIHSQKSRTGEKNGRAKLKEEDVINIRKIYSEGTSLKEIYGLYSQVTPTSIRDIINGKTWKHLL